MTPWNSALWCQTQSTLYTNHKNSGESVTSQAQPWRLCKYGYPVTSLSQHGLSLNHKLRIYEIFLWNAYIFKDETRQFQVLWVYSSSYLWTFSKIFSYIHNQNICIFWTVFKLTWKCSPKDSETLALQVFWTCSCDSKQVQHVEENIAGCCFYARSPDCEKRLLALSRLSVRPFTMNNSPPTGWIFMKSDIWVFTENLSRKFEFH